MFTSRDQYVAPDFSRYPDYDEDERPVPVRAQPIERVMAVPSQPTAGQAAAVVPWHQDRFMLILIFLVVVCLYNVLLVSRLEAEISTLHRMRT